MKILGCILKFFTNIPAPVHTSMKHFLEPAAWETREELNLFPQK